MRSDQWEDRRRREREGEKLEERVRDGAGGDSEPEIEWKSVEFHMKSQT